MKILKYIFLSGLSIIIFSQCNEVTEPSGAEEIAVVEGYLYSNEATQQIHLSLMIPLSSTDTIPEPINDAEVVVKYNGQPYAFNLSTNNSGIYTNSGEGFSINSGETYNLEVTYRNSAITSETRVPSVPENVQISDEIVYIDTDQSFFELIQNLPEPEVTWDNPEENYYFIVVENLEDDPEPIINDENAPGFNGGPFGGNLSFTTTPTNNNSYTIDLRGGHFGLHKVTVYGVNRDYVNLYEEREQDSRQLNEPPSNITNGLGIFTSFSSKNIYFRVREN